MPTHWGAVLGLVVAGVGIWRHRTELMEDPAEHLALGLVGYSLNEERYVGLHRAFIGVPIVAGAGATYAAIKTGYNDWTPTGVNV